MAVTEPADRPQMELAVISLHQGATWCRWFPRLASVVDRRSARSRVQLFLGVVLARGRRTVTSWIWSADLSEKYLPCCTTIAAVGKQADKIAPRLVHEAVKPLVAVQARHTPALYDASTQRYWDGAGIWVLPHLQ